MLTKAKNIKEALIASYWFIPALMSGAAIGAAAAALRLDREIPGGSQLRWLGWLEVNTPEGARELLSTIAGSTITVAGVIFSITVLALSFASSQYGPRLLHSFMRDRASQIVLGTFVSTYLYSLLVLRTIGPSEGEAVPHIAVGGALLLALVSIAVLIFFIHHVARAIQASSIINAVGRDLDKLVIEFLASRTRRAGNILDSSEAPHPKHVVASSRAGYVQAIAMEELLKTCAAREATIELLVSPGDYVGPMFPIAAIRAHSGSEEMEEEIRHAVVIGVQRTGEQDLEFPVDQLAEIAVRALSPSLNDPFTAVLCVKRLSASLAPLFSKPWPQNVICAPDGAPRITLMSTSADRILGRAFDQILHFGATNPVIPRQVMKALLYLHDVAQPEHAAAVVDFANRLISRVAQPADAELTGYYRKLSHPVT